MKSTIHAQIITYILQERIAALETEKKALESALENLGKDQREKVELMSAEKKARHHVS